jgi:cytochrome c peroxidase
MTTFSDLYFLMRRLMPPVFRLRQAALAIFFVVSLGGSSLFADGPGVPNRTYTNSQVLTVISRLNSDNGAPRSHGHVSMHKGYLVVIYSTDDGGSDGGFSFFDISDPFAPVLVYQKDDDETQEIREAHGYGFSSSYGKDLVALQAAYGLQIWDWTDITNPVRLSYLHLPGIEDSDYALGAWWLFWQAPYIYVAGAGNGIYIVDATDPSNPSLVERLGGQPNPIPISETGGFRLGPIFAVGNLLVASSMQGSGYVTIDISHPKNPNVLDVLGGDLPSIYSMLVNGNKILGTGIDKELYVYDINDPSNISLINSGDIDGPGGYVTFQDGYAHVGASNQYSKVDISNDANYVLVDKATSGIRNRDEDFVVPLGNLVVLSDDHGNGSFIIPHQKGKDLAGPAVNMVIPKDGALNQALTTRVGLTFTDLIDLRTVNDSTFILRPVGGSALSGKYSTQLGVVNFFPDEPLLPEQPYEVVVPKGGVKDLVGNPTESSFVSSFTTAPPQPPLTCAITLSAPAQVGQTALFQARGMGGSGSFTYSWNFGDGSAVTPFSTDSTANHVYNERGHYSVRVMVSDDLTVSSASIIQTIHGAITALAPASSSTIIFDEAHNTVWTVNPDNETVTAIDGLALSKKFEIPMGQEPSTLAKAPDGMIWVVNQGDATIRVIDPVNGSFLSSVALPYASRPYGLTFSPDGMAGYVTLQATGKLAKLDPASRSVVSVIDVGATPRGVAVSAGSDRIFVTRFISPIEHGEVIEVNPFSFTIARTIQLVVDPGPDTEATGRGVPNYLGSPTISPDGAGLWVPSKKDNTGRGVIRDGLPLTFESAVRTIFSVVDLLSNGENLSARRDLNDRDMAVAVRFSKLGDYAFVATQGSNIVDVFDTYNHALVTSLENVGRAPQGLVLSTDGMKLFVHSFLSRSVLAYDVSGIVTSASNSSQQLAEIQTVSNEKLPPLVLEGKRIFYNARDPRMSQDGYLSCASCHVNGEHDGRTWDFTDRGEGLRNTPPLLGRRGTGQGRVHWSANFDEIQDFEHDIRNAFGGDGFMSDADFNTGTRNQTLGDPKAGISYELDALAAYLSSLDKVRPSPYRNPDGSLTFDALAGKTLFQQLNCQSCHVGNEFTDSPSGALHDVGTLKPSSGQRLGQPLTRLDTPTLRGLWETPPYLHDGSAATLMDVLTVANPNDLHGFTSSLNQTEKQQLAAYLSQLDNLEPAAPPAMAALTITSPSNGASFAKGDPILITVNVAPRLGIVSKVEFLANNAKIGEAITAPYSFSWSGGNGGSYVLKARVVYANSQTAESSPVAISITQAMAVAITSPLNNANFGVGEPISIEVQTTDGLSSVNLVEFYADTEKLGEDDAAPYSFIWAGAGVGTHVLAVRALFADGNTMQSNPVTISVTPLPLPIITSPASNQNFTIGDSIVIAAQASPGASGIDKVEFYADTEKLGEDAASPYSLTWHGAAAGAHTLAARAVFIDQSSLQSNPVSINVWPIASIAISSPLNNATFVEGHPIPIAAQATAGSSALSMVEFYAGSAKLGDDATSPYEFSWNNAAAGAYLLTAKAIFANQTSLLSAPVNITVTFSTGVEEMLPLAGEYALSKVYPNPFNPSARVNLAVARAQNVRLEIFNMLGQRVAVLHEGWLAANRAHGFVIDATFLPSGHYYYRAAGEFFTATRGFTISK